MAAKSPALNLSVKPKALHTCGRFHDLAALRDKLNRLYFGNRSQAAVTWGGSIRRRAARFLRLGWYDQRRRLIVISRRLDAADVPAYVVEYVLFHEMLHEIVGIRAAANGRRKIHTSTFRLLEETFPDYARARAFEQRYWRG
ncbi:MAG: hypothetical protein N3A66_07630 [Planctomycetota bacterium]|nr:hypothetical protein [Planctomycetota bacterium]